MNEFIGVYEGAFNNEFCLDVINQTNAAIEKGYGLSRQDTEPFLKIQKDDISLSDITKLAECESKFIETFWELYPNYSNYYDILQSSAHHAIYNIKVQITKVGQGYHVWHYENNGRHLANRLLAFTLFLNTVNEGGETEFLYYPRRIKPVEGTLLVWPAGFTHTHRGNPPLSNTKYIMTGWVEF